jgi:hypothetical protein
VTDPDIVERHLERAWKALTPPAALRDRVRAQLSLSSAASSGLIGLLGVLHPDSSSPWRYLRASGRVGAAVGLGLLCVGFAAGYFARSPDDALPPALPVAHVAKPAQPFALLAPELADDERSSIQGSAAHDALPTALPAPKDRSRARHVRAPAASTPRSDADALRTNRELALLQRAERAVRAGNPALALALTGELDEDYPRSGLLEERHAIELMAHCQAGASDSGPSAARFVGAHPQSVYAARIAELCRVEPAALEAPGTDKTPFGGH